MAIELPPNPEPSLKELLAMVSREEQARILANLTPEKKKTLAKSWRDFHARPEQVEPQLWEVKVLRSKPAAFEWVLTIEGKRQQAWTAKVVPDDGTVEALARALYASLKEHVRTRLGDPVVLLVLREESVILSPVRPLDDNQKLSFRLVATDGHGAQYEWGRFWWRTWITQCGRGWGKTKTGAEWVIEQARKHPKYLGAIIGASPDEVRNIMVEGPSGILACCPPDFRPEWNPGLGAAGQLIYPNGAQQMCFSGAKADKLRGPNFLYAWVDELPKFMFPSAVWDQLQFSLRAPGNPRALVTTTPRPVPVMRAILDDPTTVRVKGNTSRNRSNLAGSYIDFMQRKYAGTRLGRQELDAELLDDVVGALWSQKTIDECLVDGFPQYAHFEMRGKKRTDEFRIVRTVVSVDPSIAGADVETRAETGIMVMCLGNDGHVYVIDDRSGDFGIQDGSAAREIVGAYRRFKADAVVVELNNGGDWIPALIHAFDSLVRVVKKKASTGKTTRAEPIAAMYREGMIHHLVHPIAKGERYPNWSELFQQLTTWTPAEKSPDRMDALVWGVAELAGLQLTKKEGNTSATSRVGAARPINFTAGRSMLGVPFGR